jgi:hypothetical protein
MKNRAKFILAVSMEKVCMFGIADNVTKGSLKMENSKEWVYIRGQTELDMKYLF